MQFQIVDCRVQIEKSSSSYLSQFAIVDLKSLMTLYCLCGLSGLCDSIFDYVTSY